MATTLKEEFLAKKYLEEKKKLIEAKYNFDENFILLEEIDQDKLEQMADAVEKLDAIISNGSLAGKLRTLRAALETATAEMQNFVANGSNLNAIATMLGKDKAFNPITKSMTLFSTLTKLFKDDLPNIVKAFRIEQAIKTYNDAVKASLQASQDDQQEQPLQEQYEQDGANVRLIDLMKISPNLINSRAKLVSMFKKALTPSGILGFFGLSKLPYINDPAAIATELLTLTPNELRQLSANITRVQIPISATDRKDIMDMAAGKVPQELAKDASQQSTSQTSEPSAEPQNSQQAGQQAVQGRLASALTNLKKLKDDQILDVVKNSGDPVEFVGKIETLLNSNQQAE